MTGVIAIPPQDVPRVWHDVRPWISSALEQGDAAFTPEQTLDAILCGRMGLWLIYDGDNPLGAFTTLVDRGAVTVFTLGGEGMADWLDEADDFVTSYGRLQGCRFVNLTGRRGWTKILQRRGYKEVSVNVVKDLAHG